MATLLARRHSSEFPPCLAPVGTAFFASPWSPAGLSRSATTESKRIRFNQLNAVTGNRLRQRLIDAETGEIVERDRIAKGYEYSRGQYVLVKDDELKALQIESARRSST
jgi:non-homologous end joining protein Ku